MIRCLQDRRRAEQQGLEADDVRYSDFEAMSQLIQQLVRGRGITKVILLARTSPGWSTSNSDIASDSSLSRQINFCQIFVDGIGVEVEVGLSLTMSEPFDTMQLMQSRQDCLINKTSS